MPILIVNSGVKLHDSSSNNTSVVFRDEGGVISRASTSLPTQRTRRFSHRGSIDASDGGAGLLGIERHTTLAVVHSGGGGGGGDAANGEGGNASSAYDMTSVFGLKVLPAKITGRLCHQLYSAIYPPSMCTSNKHFCCHLRNTEYVCMFALPRVQQNISYIT